MSRRIGESVAVPLFLAGGLKPNNIAEAVRKVEPFGVDLYSGVRTSGKLDETKLSNFFRSIVAA